MKVLVLIGRYLPGYRAGGPVRSVTNMIAGMPDRFDFWVYTADRDLGDDKPYAGLQRDAWSKRDRTHIRYVSPRQDSLYGLIRTVRELQPDVVYASSLFSRTTIRYLIARRCGLVPDRPLIVAPRGELSPGALGLKQLRKSTFLASASVSGLFDGIVWQATAERERNEITETLQRFRRRGEEASVLVAPNVTGAPGAERGHGALDSPPPKRSGTARFVFLSRISPMKNLAFGIRRLATLRGEVTLDLYGPMESQSYWREVEAAIAGLPASVVVRYLGALPPADVPGVFASHDFFLFPTLGENFGHVIFESLNSGCPVVLSDMTPWRGLELQHAGWDLPLGDEAAWVNTLQRCVDMGGEEHLEWRKCARRCAASTNASEDGIKLIVNLFERNSAPTDRPKSRM